MTKHHHKRLPGIFVEFLLPLCKKRVGMNSFNEVNWSSLERVVISYCHFARMRVRLPRKLGMHARLSRKLQIIRAYKNVLALQRWTLPTADVR